MGKKLTAVYEVLVEGLTGGLKDHELYDFVSRRCQGSSSKRVCRASVLAMSDPRVTDRAALERVYSIAVDHRFRSPA